MRESAVKRGTIDRCPLCGTSSAAVIASLGFADIWAALESQWSAHFPEAVMKAHSPADITHLRQCDNCGLQYFVPSIPGDVDFYERLMAQIHYERDRWEFGVVAQRLVADEAVLDIGCGSGAFLSRVSTVAGRRVGIDHNRNAVAALTMTGIEAHDIELEEFAMAERHTFDVVCAFHTLEHLSDVDRLLEPALACLRPGGRLFASVPNRNRTTLLTLDPLDCPPHHISRWSVDQLQALASRFGLGISRIWFEPPDFSMFEKSAMDRARQATAIFGQRLSDVSARAYRRLRVTPRHYERLATRGFFRRQRRYGHTVLAEFGATD